MSVINTQINTDNIYFQQITILHYSVEFQVDYHWLKKQISDKQFLIFKRAGECGVKTLKLKKINLNNMIDAIISFLNKCANHSAPCVCK
jgi:hypothetical protein